jgi:hypothetical protein
MYPTNPLSFHSPRTLWGNLIHQLDWILGPLGYILFDEDAKAGRWFMLWMMVLCAGVSLIA